MSDIEARTLTGTMIALSERTVNSLRERLRGRIIQKGDQDYDGSCTIWNAMIRRQPAMLVRCVEASDAVHAVRFAAEHGLMLAIRGGGHNIGGSSLCDGGLVVDFSAMRRVSVDAGNKRARVEPGALLADLDGSTQNHGLVVPLGINSTTGVAGLTLGGGFGWLSRKFGLTVDSLLSAEIVTASGEALTVSAELNPDLFWAIRGGGGNVGVVTSFEFQLHDFGPEVFCGLVVHPFTGATELLRRFRDLAASMPDDVTAWVVVRKAPPLPFLPSEVHGREVVVFAALYAGPPGQGEPALAPLLRLGTPIGTHLGIQPYAAWQTALDPLLGPGMRNYWKSHDLDDLNDGAIAAIVENARGLPSPHCEIILAQLGGAILRVPSTATAYAHRNARFVLNVHGRWEQAASDEAGISWARRVFKDVAPFANGGVYVNFMTDDEGARVPDAYGNNYGRLASIKQKYDPNNLFRVNQNIRPA